MAGSKDTKHGLMLTLDEWKLIRLCLSYGVDKQNFGGPSIESIRDKIRKVINSLEEDKRVGSDVKEANEKMDRYKMLKEMKTEDRKDIYDFAMKRSNDIIKGSEE